MSGISGLDTSNKDLLSSSQKTSQTLNFANSQLATTSSSKTVPSLDIKDVVSISLAASTESLIQFLSESESSSAKGFFNTLEGSDTANEIEQTDLLSTNPQVAEALMGLDLTSGNTGDASTLTDSTSAATTTGTTAASSSSTQLASSAHDVAALIAALEQSNPDLAQSLIQALSPNTGSSGSDSLSSTLDSIA
ncbi:MAG TPA: hypothetical protein VLZ07_11150 [Syntrophales bacterium]|nr:hypothetical protein [Syntrophales bacterium]